MSAFAQGLSIGGGSITGPGKLIAIGGSGTFGNGGSAAPAAASPKTGDGSHAEVWSALTLLCMAGLFLGLRQAKRN
ncbi:MAG: hypothetical protein MR483_03355 [Bacteroidales bacterium]|nr:hypothetical protein [Bacteroidales bacterium]